MEQVDPTVLITVNDIIDFFTDNNYTIYECRLTDFLEEHDIVEVMQSEEVEAPKQIFET